MLLKSDVIAALLRAGMGADSTDPFVITPHPDLEEIEKSGSASIDLRLGTWFVSLRESRMALMKVDDEQEVPFTKSHYVSFGDHYILHPRAFVLGVTLEWMRIPKGLAAYVVGRSSWGRRGLIIATATGVHPGFTGCLTLELSNVGQVPIAITPGLSICQLFLHRTEDTDQDFIDASQFIGLRKPSVGKIMRDPFASKLARANPITERKPVSLP